jgi:hypothetical protein
MVSHSLYADPSNDGEELFSIFRIPNELAAQTTSIL